MDLLTSKTIKVFNECGRRIKKIGDYIIIEIIGKKKVIREIVGVQ